MFIHLFNCFTSDPRPPPQHCPSLHGPTQVWASIVTWVNLCILERGNLSTPTQKCRERKKDEVIDSSSEVAANNAGPVGTLSNWVHEPILVADCVWHSCHQNMYTFPGTVGPHHSHTSKQLVCRLSVYTWHVTCQKIVKHTDLYLSMKWLVYDICLSIAAAWMLNRKVRPIMPSLFLREVTFVKEWTLPCIMWALNVLGHWGGGSRGLLPWENLHLWAL